MFSKHFTRHLVKHLCSSSSVTGVWLLIHSFLIADSQLFGFPAFAWRLIQDIWVRWWLSCIVFTTLATSSHRNVCLLLLPLLSSSMTPLGIDVRWAVSLCVARVWNNGSSGQLPDRVFQRGGSPGLGTPGCWFRDSWRCIICSCLLLCILMGIS